MALFDKLIRNARENRQRIVLPEGTEPRTLKAADNIIADGLADIQGHTTVILHYAAPDAIGAISADGRSSRGLYDLSGRRVKAAQKGLYIVDGKKVLVP